MWSLALKTLLADGGKFSTALLGLTFTVALVNVQGGLFLGLLKKVSLLVDGGEADIWVGHRGMHNVDFPEDIPLRWLDRIRALPGVAAVEPYLIGWSTMTLPNGGRESVVVVGCEPPRLMGNAWHLRVGQSASILHHEGIIVDLHELQKLQWPRLGEVREIGGKRARIVGFSEGIVGFLVAPYVFTTLERARLYCHKRSGVCSYFLVQLQPGADPEAVCQAIRQRLPDADAFPRSVYSRMSVDFWLKRTGLGISFGASTVLGLLVGLIIVAQTMYAAVLDRIPEFAALKAMGARSGQLYKILLSQAMILASLATLLGVSLVACVQWVFSTPRAPIFLPWWLVLSSSLLVLVMALASSVLPFRRIRAVDPMLALT
jgi:putative ABC transport system permease protein